MIYDLSLRKHYESSSNNISLKEEATANIVADTERGDEESEPHV
jgi:hypothetical protein